MAPRLGPAEQEAEIEPQLLSPEQMAGTDAQPLPVEQKTETDAQLLPAEDDEQEADMGSLHVIEARVDEGPYYRRWRPKDRGRAHPIAKRTSHLIVRVAER